jgi:hypothetical protein
MTSRIALTPIIFAAVLLTASVASGLIAFSPYLFVSHDQKAVGISASVTNSTVLINQRVNVSVSEKNSLRLPNELPLSGDWKVQNLTLDACGYPAQYPFGVAIFQGKYTLGNISSAKSLLLYPSAGTFLGCGAVLPGNPNSIRFSPHQNITLSLEFSGYYTNGFTPVPGQSGAETVGVHHSFAAGTYTLVVGDEWGHTDFLYFQVSRIGLGEMVLCSSDCDYPAPGLSGTVYLNSTSPLKSLQLFVNGTDEGVRTYDASLSSIDLNTQYASGFQSPEVIAHDTYTLKFVVTFEDNSTFTATTEVIAG